MARRARSRTYSQGGGEGSTPATPRRRSGRHRRPRDSGNVRRSNAVVASFAVAAAPIVGVPLALQARAKDVTLTVDGVAHDVTTAGQTVEDVLDSRDLRVDRHDLVTPSLDSPVEDGDLVSVRLGRKLDLEIDDEQQRTHWVHATKVGSALDEIGRQFPDAELTTDRDTPVSRSAPVGRTGLDLDVKTEKRITLVQAGVKTREVTTGVTVGEALQDLGVPFDQDDRVEPGLGTPVEDGTRIELVRLEERVQRVRERIPNETVVRYDDSMLEGETKVVRRGRDGVRLVTYEAVLADGEVRRRRAIEKDVRSRPVDRIEVRGTKEVFSDAPCPSGSSVESGLSANAIAVHRAVCARYPQVEDYLGLRPGDYGEHGSGHALDIMVYSDSSTGNAVAEWLRANYQRLGISEIIWSQRIWTVERSSEGWRWMEDRGSTTANHYDHVHVTVY